MEFYDRYCACGCGNRIPVKEIHKKHGIPKYIFGHYWRGRKRSEESKQKNREAHLGTKQSKESREKNRRSQKDREHVNCNCAICGARKGLNSGDRNPMRRDEVRAQFMGERNPSKREDVCRKLSKSRKVLWKNAEYVQKQMRAAHVTKNKAETKLESILDECFPGQWEFVGDGSLIIAGKNPDFAHKTEKKLIELFGDYWHGPEVQGVPCEEHEQERIQLFENEGYQLLVIWEHELKDEEKLMERIMKWEMC